jgi:hypothetical protein
MTFFIESIRSMCKASKLSGAKKLFDHLENHVEKKFACSVCQKGFSYQHLLDAHLHKGFILGHFRSFHGILDHLMSFEVFFGILGRFRSFYVILDHFRSLWVIFDHFRSF